MVSAPCRLELKVSVSAASTPGTPAAIIMPRKAAESAATCAVCEANR